MYEKYKRGKTAYLVELVVVKAREYSLGVMEVRLGTVIDTEMDGMTPRAFKNRAAANKRVTEILNGEEYIYDIRAFAIRKFTLTTKVKKNV